MKYQKIINGKFIDRPNRFIAHVKIEGKTETVHVKNTGCCRELLLPDSDVILEDFRERKEGEARKTKFDLIAVYKKLEKPHHHFKTDEILINMDSQAPNKVVYEWLLKQNFSFIKPEYTFGQSRIDFYMEKNDEKSAEYSDKLDGKIKYLLEIKGCTLERNGTGFFPDAPTERGVKHLHELAEASKKGYKCAVGFVIQMEGVSEVLPNIETHPEFGMALKEAEDAGVQVWFFLCKVKEDELEITERIIKNSDNLK